ncbi:MAG: HNH endonuclease [Rhodobacteraceae bacterium]|nr:HNH endonuclease [Paracoccaceae bacterium]
MAKKTGSKARIRRFLKQHTGKTVTSRQIQQAAGDVAEWARRLRELRAEGWHISSHNDRADLKPGEYVLETDPPAPGQYTFAHTISGRLRAQVLERNGYTCQMCGIGAGDPGEDDRPTRLHVGHIVDRKHGGKDELFNLRTLCSTCNQGAKNLVQEPPGRIWLLSQVRRASIDDQRAVLKWLKLKFRNRS